MEEPSGGKAEVEGVSALLAPLCLPKCSLGENTLHSMKSPIMLATGLQIPAVVRDLGFPWHRGLGIDDDRPLLFLPRFQLGPCLDFKQFRALLKKTGGFCIILEGENPRRVPALQLPCCLERETSRLRRLLCLPDFPLP